MVYHEDSEVVIPLPFEWGIDEKNICQFISFVKRSELSCNYGDYENNIEKVKIVEENSGTYLNLGKLPNGVYLLNFLKISSQPIVIRTLEGKVWANGAIFSEKLRRVQHINQSPSLFVTLGELK